MPSAERSEVFSARVGPACLRSWQDAEQNGTEQPARGQGRCAFCEVGRELRSEVAWSGQPTAESDEIPGGSLRH